jgi:Ca2+-transporting ATPase
MYWSKDLKDISLEFKTDLERGLSEASFEEVRKTYGLNVLTETKHSSHLTLFLKQFNNTMTYMLLLAAIVSFVLDERIDALAIFAIVVLNGVVGYIQEAKAEASIAALKKLSTPKAKVIRDGKVQVIDSTEVVPGDVLTLEAGDYIVADAVVITGFQLAADEAVLTGESMPVEKSPGIVPPESMLGDRKNMLHASTALTSGSGKAVVVSTGMNTEIGKIAGLLETTASEETPLQLRLAKVSNKLLLLGFIVMIAVALLGYSHGRSHLEIFMLAISLAVAAIPEGLPTIVTLALALSVRRMSKRNAIVRKMAAVETLGSTDVICTDKTGTLTTGNMVVREVFLLSEEKRKEFYQVAVSCNNASLDNGGSGDPTEIALLRMAENERPLPRVHEWSFDSVRKRMSVAVRMDGKTRIFTKGAPESILPLCGLTSLEEDKIRKTMTDYSKMGRRTLALASGIMNDFNLNNPPTSEEAEKNLLFLGIVAIADPPKEETIPSIRACKASGIKVIMITGDHPLTAEAIARELGIIEHEGSDVVMTGTELEALSPEELRKKSQKILVYARVSPEHKLKIVEALQKNGHTVSMTGDGVNDAPALKKASIGVAMGKAGTEVARQASNMILTDDNFSTIVHAVEEGRAIFGNIKRTIQYLLSTNLAEILIVLGASILGMPVPFVPISLLWINLVTDGFPSLALAAEPVEKDFLKNNREPSPSSFFNRGFMRELFFVAIVMTIIELVVYAYMLRQGDEHIAKSYAFNLLVYLCLFRSFSCRSETRTYFQMKINKIHILSVLIPISLQVILENFKFFNDMFEISSLSFKEHLILIIIGTVPVGLVELRKLIRMKDK